MLLSGKNLPHKTLDIILYNSEFSGEEQSISMEDKRSPSVKKSRTEPPVDISDKEDLIEISELDDFDDDEIKIDSDSLIEEILRNG